MAVTANTPRGGNRPPPGGKTDHETMAKEGKGQKKRCASDGGNTADKSHKRSSTEGDDDKKSSTKGDGAMTPHDRNAETNLKKDPCCGDRPPPHKKNDQESMDKGRKGQKKHSASYDSDTADKIHKWSSAEGNDDKNKDAGTNGASGDGERLTATNGRDTSSTKGDGTTTPHDCHAETNLQKDADTHSSAEGDDNKNKDACTNGAPGDGKRLTATNDWDTSSTKRKGATTPHDCSNAETNEQKDAGTVSQSIFKTPVPNTTVSNIGFFQFGKTRKSNVTKIFHNTSS
jgi:hypothetical protein